jgi:hypothetical protein
MAANATILSWRPLSGRGGLVGYASVRFGSGLIVSEIGVFVRGERVWCAPPAKPLTKDGSPILDERGKPRWLPLIGFATHGVRSSWSRQIIAAIQRQYPEALPS